MKKMSYLRLVCVLLVCLFVSAGCVLGKKSEQSEPVEEQVYPIAEWLLDEGEGDTLSDSSGNGRTGNPMPGAQWINGLKGKGLDASAQGAFRVMLLGEGNVLNYGSWNAADMTIEMWVNPNEDLFNQDISENINLLSAANLHFIYWRNSGQFQVVFFDSGGTRYQLQSTYQNQLKSNTWHHMAFVINATGEVASIYHNGVEIGSLQIPKNMRFQTINPGVGNMRFGVNIDGSSGPFPGVIDIVRIYDVALKANQLGYFSDAD